MSLEKYGELGTDENSCRREFGLLNMSLKFTAPK